MSVYNADSSIVGYRAISPQWEGVLTQHGAVPDATTIIERYDLWCHAYHLDPNLLLSQACHEATYFTSVRWTTEWNPAGLGIVADNTPPNPFKSPQEGIQAHCSHICAYVYDGAECPVDHANMADRRHGFHDGMPRVRDLVRLPARAWANPGVGYAASIVSIANEVTGGTPAMAEPTQADLGYPGRVHYATGSGEAMDIASVRWFVVHDTEGHFAGDEQTLSGQISAHLLIDKTGEWRFMVPLASVAYATGNLPVNRQSISVEQSGFADAHDGGYTDAQYRCAAAFFRFCVANGMVNVPAAYVGKQDANGGPEPDVAGILGHQDVPRDDGRPGWGGNYGHTDPGASYDWAKLIAYIFGAPPPPPPPPSDGSTVINGHRLGAGFADLYRRNPDLLRAYGFPVSDEYSGYLVVDAPAPLNKKAIPVTIMDFERVQFIYDVSTPDPFRVRVPLRSELAGPPDNIEIVAVLHAMELAAGKGAR